MLTRIYIANLFHIGFLFLLSSRSQIDSILKLKLRYSVIMERDHGHPYILSTTDLVIYMNNKATCDTYMYIHAYTCMSISHIEC